MPHPLVLQLRFSRSEFKRALEGLTDEDARTRVKAMNCISWNVGHLAWQEQRFWLTHMQHKTLLPDLNEKFCFGCPGITPPLDEMWSAWEAVVKEADPFLDTLTTDDMMRGITIQGISATILPGNLMQRVIYHYWYHLGESAGIRQALGHTNLPDFVGSIEKTASYQPHR